MESSFKIEKEGNVAWLILNRPEKRNSMTWEFFAELGGVSSEPSTTTRRSGRSSSGRRGRCSPPGLDLVAAGSLLGDGSAAYREGLRKKILGLQEAINAIERCRKPVIAAVHGHCIGGGVDLLPRLRHPAGRQGCGLLHPGDADRDHRRPRDAPAPRRRSSATAGPASWPSRAGTSPPRRP